MSTPKKIAAIITEYRQYSHADVIIGKFLRGFPTDNGIIAPRVQIASMYVDQFPDNDMARAISAEFNVPIYPSIAKALTLGGEALAVDGVLLIGEHGDYPWNEQEQQLYPRKYFMEQICGVLAGSGRAVPIFNDKHLAYNWHDAQWMVERARQLGAPLMAGSSLPLAWRNPWLEHAPDSPIQAALSIFYGGLDSYGFHAVEALQAMVERRVGGESGVAAVTCVEGDAVWQAIKAGRLARDLVDAACATLQAVPDQQPEALFTKPALYLIDYRDGLRGAVLMENTWDSQFKQCAYAARVAGEVVACEVHLGDNPFPHFSYLSLNVEEMFTTGQPTYPVERTLLASGVLEAALQSRYRGHTRVETPHLAVSYRSYALIPWRTHNPRPVAASIVPMH
ncbi:MAG: hypothetical protein M3Q45_08445 [Chloroflexota bacterium]|nr:hypothetical protein [Chloroflexota bacterium]